MAADFDDFLSGLRVQLTEAADAAAEPRRRAATPRLGRPHQRRRRLLVAFAAGLLLGVAGVAGGVLAAGGFGHHGSNAPSQMLPVGGSGSPAVVLPLTPSLLPSPITSATPSIPGYALSSVAAPPSAGVWAVGERTMSDESQRGGSGHSFILQSNGSGWREAPTPDIGPLGAVSAAPDGQAWAIRRGGGDILHWNGIEWAAASVTSPAGSALYGIHAVASNDVWAVGSAAGAPLVLHSDGNAWRPVQLPQTYQAGGSLTAVAADGANDVWVVGTAAGAPLVLHWDGSVWSAPGSVASAAGLSAVSVASATDVWAIGDGLLHWDGTQWLAPPAPAVAAGSVATSATGDVWAIAADRRGVVSGNGQSWRTIGADELGLGSVGEFELDSVAAAASGDVWVVGSTISGGDDTPTPLIIHWDGAAWRIVVDFVRVSDRR